MQMHSNYMHIYQVKFYGAPGPSPILNPGYRAYNTPPNTEPVYLCILCCFATDQNFLHLANKQEGGVVYVMASSSHVSWSY